MAVNIKKYFAAVIVITSIVFASAIYLYWYGHQSESVIPEHLQGMGGDFTLQSANGPVSLKDYRGNIVLLFFGYTNCPDVCPLTLSNWSSAFEKLSGHELEQVKGLFVSVDPSRDTLDVLKAYTEYFHPNITGVTGNHDELVKIAASYRSDFHLENEGKGENYAVDHMSFVYVIGRQGKVRDLLSHSSSPEDIVRTVRKIL